jgi:ABC-type transport system involved in cytochrome bd biosynthesis fused ATPase/permease subunit
MARSLSSGDVPAADRTYLAQLVAARTGVSDTDAQKRVDDTIAQVQADETKARQAADAARKASAAASIFTALAMVIGAFIACAAAALGGQLRDLHP